MGVEWGTENSGNVEGAGVRMETMACMGQGEGAALVRQMGQMEAISGHSWSCSWIGFKTQHCSAYPVGLLVFSCPPHRLLLRIR